MVRPIARRALHTVTALLPALALTWTGEARAQTTGTLVGVVSDASTGRPVPGALVVATSPALQGEQTAVTDGAGRYLIPLLPPGRYRVAARLDGYQPGDRRDLLLRVDYTLRANLALVPEAVRIEEQVVRTGIAPAVNVGTAESGTIVSAEFLATVPTTRQYNDAAIIAPTAQFDAAGIAFAGATSPENNYILDGLRVGDPSVNYNGANLLVNFVEQLDVKTGSFMPEYGYSSAGILNAVTKSGSNEFHGSLWGNLQPGLFSPRKPTSAANGTAIASYASPYKGSYDADFGFEVGGPILKDRLWFYAGFAPQLVYDVRTGFYQSRVPSAADPSVAAMASNGEFLMEPIPGTEFVYGTGSTKYFGVAKLSWQPGENHGLVASLNTQPTRESWRNTNASRPAGTGALQYNTTNAALGYSGKLLEKHLLVEVRAGWYESPFKYADQTVDGVPTMQTPRISWATLQPFQNFEPGMAALCPYPSRQAGIGLAPGCYVQGYGTGGLGFAENSTTTRWSGTASATALFDLGGPHQLKGGVQIDYSEYDGTRSVSGGSGWTAFGRFLGNGVAGTGGSFNAFSLFAYGALDPAGAVTGDNGRVLRSSNWCTSVSNGACVNPGGRDTGLPGSSTARTSSWANGYYLQDSWTIANVLTLNFGVRTDTQDTSNDSPDVDPTAPKLALRDMWAPRVQAIWDFTGSGRGKIQASWGRYYESVPMGIAWTAFGSGSFIDGAYQLSSCTNAVRPGPTARGNPASACPNVFGLDVGEGPGPNLVRLGPSPIALGPGFSVATGAYSPVAPDLRGQYTDQFGGGVQYEVLQDLSLGVEYLGRRLGTIIEDMSNDDGTTYMVANPTVSAPWTVTSGPYQGVTFNPRQSVASDPATGNVYAITWPKPVRSYDGVTVTLAKAFSRRWLAQASYTWSSLRGNFPGLLQPESNLVGPNYLPEYDLPSFVGNRTGPLGLDRTHQVKAAGSYSIPVTPDITFVPGVQLVAMSGRPQNAFAAHPLYGRTQIFLVPRGFAGNLPWVVDLDLSAQVVWAVGGPYRLAFTVSAFNALNLQGYAGADQRYTFDLAQEIQGAQCSAKNAISQPNPIAALQRDCPDLPYARTYDDRQVSPNLNYGRAQAWQDPIRVRLGVSLSF